jgi:hypothetical protein
MRLRTLADEVSRVSLEVGSQGLLGRVAHVPDVEGVWAEMTSNVGSALVELAQCGVGANKDNGAENRSTECRHCMLRFYSDELRLTRNCMAHQVYQSDRASQEYRFRHYSCTAWICHNLPFPAN